MPEVVTAQEALRLAQRDTIALNASRYAPTMDEFTQEASDAHRVYIFNVGPWALVRQCGSCGTYRVSACPEGKEYSEPLVVDGLVGELYPKDETEYVLLPKVASQGQLRGYGKGMLFAQALMGEGPHTAPNQSWRPFGVFISDTPKPSKAALDAARKAMKDRCVMLVAEANEFWSHGRSSLEVKGISEEWHHKAAQLLKRSAAECPWLADTEAPAERDNCPGCGEVYTKGIMKHRCGFILDKKRYDEAVKAGLFSA